MPKFPILELSRLTNLNAVASPQSLNSRLNLRDHWLIIIFWLGLCVVDFTGRLIVDRNQQTVGVTVDTLGPIEVPILRDSLYKNYTQKLSQRVKAVEGKVVSDTEFNESNELDIIEARDLREWVVGDHAYRLVGVFGGRERFAVLRRAGQKTNNVKLLEVRIGDLIEGFYIDDISAHEIIATHLSGAKIELRLFKMGDDRSSVPGNVK